MSSPARIKYFSRNLMKFNLNTKKITIKLEEKESDYKDQDTDFGIEHMKIHPNHLHSG